MKYPSAVQVCEVGPRDGFQNMTEWIDTNIKIQTIDMLFQAGADYMEATSFISPKAIPQMRDAEEVIRSLSDTLLEKSYALVANWKGVERAMGAGVKNITYVLSASESHNTRNVRKSTRESLEELSLICRNYPSTHIKLSRATVFGCPFEGAVSLDRILFIADAAISYGVEDICLCDTIGVANPLQITDIVSALQRRYPNTTWSLHLHNTRGLAAANTMAALELGISRYETAAAGLGGCPFALGASAIWPPRI